MLVTLCLGVQLESVTLNIIFSVVVLLVNDLVVLFIVIFIGYDIKGSPSVALKVILADSSNIDLLSHTKRSPHDHTKFSHPKPPKCLSSLNWEISPIYCLEHSKYFVLTWGNLLVHKAL